MLVLGAFGGNDGILEVLDVGSLRLFLGFGDLCFHLTIGIRLLDGGGLYGTVKLSSQWCDAGRLDCVALVRRAGNLETSKGLGQSLGRHIFLVFFLGRKLCRERCLLGGPCLLREGTSGRHGGILVGGRRRNRGSSEGGRVGTGELGFRSQRRLVSCDDGAGGRVGSRRVVVLPAIEGDGSRVAQDGSLVVVGMRLDNVGKVAV